MSIFGFNFYTVPTFFSQYGFISKKYRGTGAWLGTPAGAYGKVKLKLTLGLIN
jgi:hypothetical protein